MKRRLEIARGILHYPQVLFLDEPTLGLDPQTRPTSGITCMSSRRREHITIFMTTHYMDEAEFCDRIAIIDQRHDRRAGTPDEPKTQVGGDIVTLTTTGHPAAAAAADPPEMYFEIEPQVDGTLRLEVEDGARLLPQLFSG